MTAISILDLKKKIRIEFDYKFDWNFVAVCRDLGISWDAKNKIRFLEFSPATIPLDIDKFLLEYKKIFNYYSPLDVDRFKKTFQLLINKYTNKVFKEQKFDLSKYSNIDEYQKIAIEFLLNRGSAILADDMGVGKTRETCIYILEKNPKKVLFVTPLSVREVWRDELVLNLGENENDFCIVEKKIENKKYVIINYDKLKNFEDILDKGKWDIIIFDEAHYLKSKDSKRFKLAKKIAKKCDNIICVTGTPIMNRPAELFPLLHLIKHPLGLNWTAFANRYCDRKLVMFGPKGHWDVSGASNLIELSEKIKDIMIRREKKSVLKDIPEKEYHIYNLNFSPKQKKEYESIENNYSKYIKSEKYFDRGNHLANITKMRQYCSNAKIPIVEQHIKDALSSGEKILVFGFYIDPLLKLQKKYENSLIITGQTDKKERANIIKQFQEDDYYKIFFGQIIAAGFGITLTAANRVIFNDLYWNPAIHEQSEDRANRRGATLDTQIYYPIFKNSIEEDIFKLIKEKEKLIDKIMNKTIDFYKPESMETEIINLMKKKYGKS